MKRILSLVLAVIIGVTASVNAFAASAKKTYISELVAVTASSADDAKSQLEKAGYKLLSNANVNSTLKSGVYLGYKETENADEAITDIAGMNMKGKFSYSDYKTIMEQNREAIKETIDDFLPVIAEFQENYKAEKSAALAAYKAMNVFKDDDSGKLMGDYLVDFKTEDESQVQKLTDTFMQANSMIIYSIMQQAAFAGDDSGDTLIDRMVKTGPDGIAKKFKGLYPSVAKANQAMAAEYGETANVIYNDWNNVYEYICETEKELIKYDEDGNIMATEEIFEVEDASDLDGLNEEQESYIEGLNAMIDTADVSADVIDFTLYNLLAITEYGDGTLLDFFKRPASEVKKEELYPLIDAMSEGQRSQIGMNGLKYTLECAFSDIDEDSEDSEESIETVEAVAESFETTSIYDGVDRSIFEDGVAFTSAATEHEKTTGESWLTKLTGIETDRSFWLNTMIISSLMTCVLVATYIGASFAHRTQLLEYGELLKARETARTEFQLRKDFIAGKIDTYKGWTKETAFVDGANSEGFDKFLLEEQKAYRKAINDPYSYNYSTVPQIIRCMSLVLLVVALAVDIYSIYQYITTPEPEEEQIPHHIMTAMATPYGEDYVYYQTVKNLNGEAADTNNHEADVDTGWLVLYTTKDAAAGDPILAENMKIQTGSSSFKEGTSFVHLFNETSALNLTAELYTSVSDKANGTYLLFNRDASTLIGAAITNGSAALIGAGGLALGAVLGAVIAKLTGKKKKETAPAEA